jgi:transcriptional regulator with XRE-family HTH domain
MVTTSGGRAGVFVAPQHAAAIAGLGALVAAARTERGFSPQEFAAHAAISTADLAALEAGDAGTTLAVLHAVAEALDMSAGELLAGPPPQPQPQPRTTAAPRTPEPAHAPQYVFVTDAAARPEHAVVEPIVPQPVPVASAPGAQPVRTASAPHAGRSYVTRVPDTAGAPAPRRTHGVPRTFADLRVGVLAERAFPTLPHFAVAAVTEAGHAISVVARIFRVPAWKLEGWVRDGVSEPPAARTRQWT